MAKKPEFDLSAMLEAVTEGLEASSTSMLTYVPHEQQKVFHSSDKHEKLFIGGNRSGKTVGSVLECLWRLTKTHPFRPELNEIKEPIRGRLVAVSFVDGVEMIILPLFKKWVDPKFLINRSWDDSYNSRTKVLTMKDGSFIEFRSYDQELEKFAGTSRHFIAFDEEPPMSIWQECKMRLLDTEGSWWISMTPVEGMTWIFTEVYEKWRNGQRPNTLVIEVNTDDNPHLTDFGKDLVFGDMDEEERNTRKAGGFNENTGKIYKSFDENIHVREPFIPRKEYGGSIYTSLDTGFRHPAVWLWHYVFPNHRVITFHEISESNHTVKMMADKVKEYERNHITPLGWTDWDIIRTGDPALKQTRENTGVSTLNEYAMQGLYMGVENVTREVDIGLIRVTQYLDERVKAHNKAGGVITVPMWQIANDCPKLIKGMKTYRWDKYTSKKMEYEKAPKATPYKKNDDEVDSARYFFTLMPEITPAMILEAQKTDSRYYAEKANINLAQYSSDYDPQPRVFQSSQSYSMEGY